MPYKPYPSDNEQCAVAYPIKTVTLRWSMVINLTYSGGLGTRDWFINRYYIGTSSEAGSVRHTFKQTGKINCGHRCGG